MIVQCFVVHVDCGGLLVPKSDFRPKGKHTFKHVLQCEQCGVFYSTGREGRIPFAFMGTPRDRNGKQIDNGNGSSGFGALTWLQVEGR